MANPLVNELIINTPFKDGWNAAEPENGANFQAFYKNPVVATELNLVFGVPIVPIDGSSAANRTDLMGILLKYPGRALNGTNCGTPCSELLQLPCRGTGSSRRGHHEERHSQELSVPANAVQWQELPSGKLRRDRTGRQPLRATGALIRELRARSTHREARTAPRR